LYRENVLPPHVFKSLFFAFNRQNSFQNISGTLELFGEEPEL